MKSSIKWFGLLSLLALLFVLLTGSTGYVPATCHHCPPPRCPGTTFEWVPVVEGGDKSCTAPNGNLMQDRSFHWELVKHYWLREGGVCVEYTEVVYTGPSIPLPPEVVEADADACKVARVVDIAMLGPQTPSCYLEYKGRIVYNADQTAPYVVLTETRDLVFEDGNEVENAGLCSFVLWGRDLEGHEWSWNTDDYVAYDNVAGVKVGQVIKILGMDHWVQTNYLP